MSPQETMNNKCAGSNYKNKLIDILKNKYGWSDDDINDIADELNTLSRGVLSDDLAGDFPVFDSDDLNLSNSVINENSTETDNYLYIKADGIANQSIAVTTDDLNNSSMAVSTVVNQNVEVYKAKKSLNIPEPVFAGAKVTPPVDLDPADYSSIEDYPDTYGFIDEAKNFIKINKKMGKAEFVHQSNVQIKMDKNGNVTLYVPGSLKHIVDGDYSLLVKGNMDLIVNGKKVVTWTYDDSGACDLQEEAAPHTEADNQTYNVINQLLVTRAFSSGFSGGFK